MTDYTVKELQEMILQFDPSKKKVDARALASTFKTLIGIKKYKPTIIEDTKNECLRLTWKNGFGTIDINFPEAEVILKPILLSNL